MLEYIRQEANMTKTENGAAAYESSGSCCLDLFATIDQSGIIIFN